MNKRIQDLMYHAGLTASGCWDEMDDYDRKAIEKFGQLIVRECVEIIETQRVPVGNSPAGEMAAKWTMDALRECRDEIKEYFNEQAL
jgi:hypothetical protein